MWLVSIDTVNWFKYMGTTTDSKLNFTGNVDLNCKKKYIYIILLRKLRELNLTALFLL